MNYKTEQEKQDKEFEKSFCDTLKNVEWYGDNSLDVEIKSHLLSRDTALLEAVMKDVSDLPTEFPEYESDDRDAGAKAFKERVLSFITP